MARQRAGNDWRSYIMTYGQFTPEELKTYCPTVVLVDAKNQVVEVRRYNDLLTSLVFQSLIGIHTESPL